MNLRTFFDIASPTTLASLIADVQMAGTGATGDQLQIERRAMCALVAIVGETEANSLVSEYADAAGV